MFSNRLIRQIWPGWFARRRPIIVHASRRLCRPVLELLEGRTLPAVGLDSFAEFAGANSTTIDIQSSDFTLSSGKVILGFTLNAPANSSFNPGLIGIVPQGSATASILVQKADTAADNSSLTIAQVSAGVFTINVQGSSQSLSQCRLDVFLAGDADGHFQVDQNDQNLITSLEGQGLGDTGYRIDADVNRDGLIDANDLALAQENQGAATSIRPLAVSLGVEAPFAVSGDAIVYQSAIQVGGQTTPGTHVFLYQGSSKSYSQQTTAGSDGSYSFNVAMALGSNALRVQTATDAFGQQPSSSLTVNFQKPTSVAFSDPNLAQAVRSALGLAPSTTIMTSDMARLVSLSADSNQIKSLNGLQSARNLQTLNLTPADYSNMPLRSAVDVSPLSNLQRLTSATLQGLALSGGAISTLARLPDLTYLDLRYNHITSIAGVGTNYALQSLLLYGNPLTNVSGLKGKFIDTDLPVVNPGQATTIAGLAQALNFSPLQIYQYVLNHFSYQPYSGSMKGAQGAFETGGGSSLDLASLLVTLLTDSGVTARFVDGAGQASAQDVMNLLGVTDPNVVATMLPGYTQTITDGGGKITAFQFGRYWVQVSVPLPAGGSQWVNLDPSWKLRDYQSGIQRILNNVPFNAAAQSSYLSQPLAETTAEWYENQVTQYLQANLPGTTLADVPYTGPIQQQLVSSLSASLPYAITNIASIFTQIPTVDTHRVTFTINFGTKVLLQATYSLPSICYDQINIDFSSSNYLNLAPQLLLNGTVAVQGIGPLEYGFDEVSMTIGHLLPGDSTVSSSETYYFNAGEYVSVGLDAQQICGQFLNTLQTSSNNAAIAHIDGKSLSFENQIGPMLSLGVNTYFNDLDAHEATLAGLTGSVVTYSGVQTGVAESYGSYAFDVQLQNPAVPNSEGPTFDIRGDTDVFHPIDNDQSTAIQRLLLAGFDSSSLENTTWEKLLSVASISTIKSLQIAHQDNITVYTINSSNSWQINQLNLSQSVKDSLTSEVQSGNTVVVPGSNTPLNLWNGVGWLVLNADGSPASFTISGSLSTQGPQDGGSSGGVITPPPPVAPGTPDPNQSEDSDPVNIANGNVARDETDVTLPGIGLSLSFARHYDSQSSLDLGLGMGWEYSGGDLLQFGAGGVVTWVASQGYHYTFTPNGSGGFANPNTLFGTFSANSGGYQYVDTDGLTYAFSGIGQLVGETDRYGNALLVARDSQGRMTALYENDSPTQRLTFSWSGSHIASVSDPTGRTWRYNYSGSELASVTSPSDLHTSSATIQYAYYTDKALGGLLRSVTEPNGAMTQFSYYPNRRAFQVTDANGNTNTFSFNLYRSQTAFTDGNSGVAINSYNNAGNLIGQTNSNGTSETFNWQNGVELSMTDVFGATTSYQYDSKGNVTKITDPANNVTTMTFDPTFNQVTSITAPGNEVTQFAYDSQGNRIKITDALNDVTTMTYAANGLLLSETSPLGETTNYAYNGVGQVASQSTNLPSSQSFGYDSRGNLISKTDADGNTTTYTYDVFGRLTQAVDAALNKTSDAYDSVGNLISSTDQLGRTTHYAYDSLHHLLNTTFADGTIEMDRYDQNGNLIMQINQLGLATSTLYDSQNEPVETLRVDGATSQTRYDGGGRVVATIDPLGHITTYSYDLLNQLTSTTDTLGGKTTRTYDANGNLLSTTDALNNQTQYQYDLLNRQTAVIAPIGTTTTTYDGDGNVLSVTDPLNHHTQYTYDISDRPVKTTNALGQTTTTTYDAAGNVMTVTDASHNTTSNSYDKLNRLVTETGPDGRTQFGYDGAGQLVTVTDADGRATAYSYDLIGRVASEQWLDATGRPTYTIRYGYDAAGELTSASDPDASYSYAYNPFGQMASADNQGTPGAPRVLLSYGYDAAGNIVSVNDQINGTTNGSESYVYDAASELTSAIQSGNCLAPARADFTYDADGNLSQLTRYADAEGTQTVATSAFSYDKNNRLTGLTHSANSTTIAQYQWTYDSAGNITQQVSADGTANYTYDVANELTAVANSSLPNESYSYDSTGNRTGGGNQTGSGNELVSDGTYNYTYDADGNLIKRTSIGTNTSTVYSWDYRNRLTKVVSLDAGSNVTQEVDYTYDMFDRLIAESVQTGAQAPVVQRYVYDGSNIAFRFDGSGNLTDRFLYGPGSDQILADAQAGTNIVWVLADSLGSIRDLINSSGTVVDHISYNSFGQVVAETNISTNFFFGFTGRLFDHVTGLQLNRERWYDPAQGRFISQDPTSFSAGDVNLYRYAVNEPTRFVDPTGLECWGGFGDELGCTDASDLSDAPGPLNSADFPRESTGNSLSWSGNSSFAPIHIQPILPGAKPAPPSTHPFNSFLAPLAWFNPIAGIPLFRSLSGGKFIPVAWTNPVFGQPDDPRVPRPPVEAGKFVPLPWFDPIAGPPVSIVPTSGKLTPLAWIMPIAAAWQPLAPQPERLLPLPWLNPLAGAAVPIIPNQRTFAPLQWIVRRPWVWLRTD